MYQVHGRMCQTGMNNGCMHEDTIGVDVGETLRRIRSVGVGCMEEMYEDFILVV